jgi:hypothetical protein
VKQHLLVTDLVLGQPRFIANWNVCNEFEALAFLLRNAVISEQSPKVTAPQSPGEARRGEQSRENTEEITKMS